MWLICKPCTITWHCHFSTTCTPQTVKLHSWCLWLICHICWLRYQRQKIYIILFISSLSFFLSFKFCFLLLFDLEKSWCLQPRECMLKSISIIKFYSLSHWNIEGGFGLTFKYAPFKWTSLKICVPQLLKTFKYAPFGNHSIPPSVSKRADWKLQFYITRGQTYQFVHF